MSLTRRNFLWQTALAALALRADRAAVVAPAELNASSLTPFVDPLPTPAVARPVGTRPSPEDPRVSLPYYRIEMREFFAPLHRDLPPARLWGYGGALPGPTFVARSGEGLLVEWVNRLPVRHFLPIDHRMHGAEADLPDTRAVVHLHGAKVRADSDGYPEDWFVPGHSALCHYPNRQEAAMLWYHDHAMGINRLNIYAGLLGAFLLRDPVEDALHLPGGACEIPLIVCDRLLFADGQLHYPVSGISGAPWVPEVFGDAMLVNGKIFPYLEVEPRRYRFRVLNGSNGRFYRLSLSNRQGFHIIGVDQGFLPAPVPLRELMLAPAERADLIVDFAGHAGERIVLQSDAQKIMQFRVAGSAIAASSPLPARLRPVAKLPESTAVRTRRLSLNEYDDERGNSNLMLLNAARWAMPVTETPVLDTVEIWSLVNLTDDAHPIHLHLVRFQILDRRRFDDFAFQTAGELHFTGPAVPPDPSEAGWKDTVRADPKMVTRIIVRFEGFAGRYVWHCHILEHEDNEMMRPYDVLAPSQAAGASASAERSNSAGRR